jgi:hypothetical protein
MSRRMSALALRSAPLHLLALAASLGGVLACSGPNDQRETTSQPIGEGRDSDAAPDGAKPAPASNPADGGEPGEAGTGGDAKVEPPPPAPAEPTNPYLGLDPLGEAEKTAMWAGEVDTPFDVDIHYIQSNETRHDVWFEYIRDKKGAFVGVGSDQSYTLIGVAKSELVFMIDIDQRVVDLHKAYEVLIEAAETPEAHVAMWDKKNEASTIALLEKAFAERGPDESKRLMRNFRASRETVFRHLQRVISRKRDGAGATWLADPEAYAHVRKLWQSDRIRSIPGDLSGAKSMITIGNVLKAIDVPLTVFYMSNAEEYFPYSDQFAANVTNFPGSPDAIVLRTLFTAGQNADKWVPADGRWNYQVQPLTDFQQRLAENDKNKKRRIMLLNAAKDGSLEKTTDVEGFSRLAWPPKGQ